MTMGKEELNALESGITHLNSIISSYYFSCCLYLSISAPNEPVLILPVKIYATSSVIAIKEQSRSVWQCCFLNIYPVG